MGLSHEDDTRENFLELYRELFSHVCFMETAIERLIHGQRVEAQPFSRSALRRRPARRVASHHFARHR